MIAMRSEHELVPYAPGRLEGDPVLVLAPHPDDEVFGCGGFLAGAAEEGRSLRVVILTDGAAQGEAETRRRESLEAAALLGIPEPAFAGLPDRGLAPDLGELEAVVRRELRESGARLVLAPSPAEVHPDHRALALVTYRCLAETGQAALATYEVSAVLHPNVLLDVTPVWSRVQRAAQAFSSQLAVHPYLEVLEALATARRLTLGAGVHRAEAYFQVPPEFPASHTAMEWAALQGPSAGLETPDRWAVEAEELAARLRSELDGCRRRLHDARDLQRELEACRARIRELEATLHAITTSRTWRLHDLLERLRGR